MSPILLIDPLTGTIQEAEMLHETTVSKCSRTTMPATNLLDLISQARIEANYAEMYPSGGHMMNLRLILNDMEDEAKKLPLSLWEEKRLVAGGGTA